MNRFIGLMIVMLCIIPFAGEAEDVIQKGELLALQRCMEIALKQQPNIVSAQNTAGAFENKIGEAKSGYYPQINGSAGYSRISPVSSNRFVGSVNSGQVISSTGGSFDQYTASVSLSQNIYDFGRTYSQVKISNFNYNSSLNDLENVTQLTILNVKQAYYGVLQTKRSRDVNLDTVKQFEQHLKQAKGFYEVGTKPKFDVTKAEVDLSNARLNLIKAENALRIAIVNLNNVMGVPDAPEYQIEDNLGFVKYETTLADALSKAYQNRPDIKSVAAKRQSAEASMEYAKSNYYPFLTGSASYSWAGESLDSIDNGWSIGAAVSVPIFSGFLTKYQVAEAKSNLNVLRANEESLRQTVIFDVQQAYLNLKQAEESVPTAELGVRQAQENFEIANGRYAAGVGNPIEVTDAEVLLANAKLNYIQTLYNYKVSQANLEKAMGTR